MWTPCRNLGHRVTDRVQPLDRHAGLAALVLGRRPGQPRPGPLEPVDLVHAVAGRGFVRGGEVSLEAVVQRLRLVLAHRALLDQAPGVDLTRGRMLGDLAVHQGLGEARLVGLVVAVAAVAPEIDHHVLLEAQPELGREPRHVHDRLGVVAIDVEDRRLNASGDVRGIGRGAGVGRARGEADLIVDDQMDRAAGAVTLELRHLEALVHHSLAGEGGVAVQEKAHDPRPLGVALLSLLGADLAEHHRVDRLEMGRVGGQAEMNPAAVGQLAIGRGAEVILDVARSEHVVGHGRALELGEDRRVGLAHHVGEHVEAAAMGHADHDLVDAELDRFADDRLERRHGALAAVEAEALGARELDVQEALEALGQNQLLEDVALLLGAGAQQIVRAFHARLDPGLLVRILNVHELDADLGAVGLAQDLDDPAQARLLQAEDVVEEELAVQIGLGEAVGTGVELRVLIAAGEAKRVEIGEQVAANPIGADQHHDPQMIDDQPPRALAAEIDDLAAECCGRGQRRRQPVAGPRVCGGAATLEQRPGLRAELVEIGAPARVDRAGIGQITGIQILDEGAIAAVEECGLLKFELLGHGSGSRLYRCSALGLAEASSVSA